MRKKLLVLMFVSLGFYSIKAQCFEEFYETENHDFYFGESDREIPVCLTKKYKATIDLDALTAGYVVEPINNDSMYQQEFNPARRWPAHNKQIPVTFDFKEKAVKINIEEGTLWILKITSPTAYQLGVMLNDFEIPEGARLIYFVKDYTQSQPPLVNCKESAFYGDGASIKGWDKVWTDNYFIESFELKTTTISPQIVVENLRYGYAPPNGLRPPIIP